MILLNQVLKKPHIQSLVVPTWVEFLEPRPFVKQNVEFTNVSGFNCGIKEKQSTANKCVYLTLFSYEVRTTGFGLYIRPSSASTSFIDIRTLLVREEKAFTFTNRLKYT
jgi:hypothetical protein